MRSSSSSILAQCALRSRQLLGCIRVLLALCLTLPCRVTATDTGTVWILSDQDNTDHAQLVDAFTDRLADTGTQPLRVHRIGLDATADQLPSDPNILGRDVILAVGSAAAQHAKHIAQRTPILHVLIPRLLYESEYADHPRTASHSALFIDQPLTRQLNLCRIVMPSARHIGVLYGPSSQQLEPLLRAAAAAQQLSLHAGRPAKGANPVSSMKAILDDSQLLLALPDPEVFNRYTVAGLLLTAYHRQVPIIGFSDAYVRAGALAAVFTTPEQIGQEAAEILRTAHTPRGWKLPAPAYPTYFSVAVNRQVARSLVLPVPDQGTLQSALQRMEPKQP